MYQAQTVGTSVLHHREIPVESTGNRTGFRNVCILIYAERWTEPKASAMLSCVGVHRRENVAAPTLAQLLRFL
jgi:hypothetical protein